MVFLAWPSRREMEILSLKWNDADLHKGMIALRVKITKSNKSRSFFLADEPLWVLHKWGDQTEPTGLVLKNPCQWNDVR